MTLGIIECNETLQKSILNLKILAVWPRLIKFDQIGLLNEINFDFYLEIEFGFDLCTIAQHLSIQVHRLIARLILSYGYKSYRFEKFLHISIILVSKYMGNHAFIRKFIKYQLCPKRTPNPMKTGDPTSKTHHHQTRSSSIELLFGNELTHALNDCKAHGIPTQTQFATQRARIDRLKQMVAIDWVFG